LYDDWLDSKAHTAFTNSPAQINPVVGGAFSAWDGYIQGKTIELNEGERILQSWRTSDFAPQSEDSLLEVLFTPTSQDEIHSTRLTLRHSHIPEGQAEVYEQGWQDFYFKPMLTYYSHTNRTRFP